MSIMVKKLCLGQVDARLLQMYCKPLRRFCRKTFINSFENVLLGQLVKGL